jgi:hypothetical protein
MLQYDKDESGTIDFDEFLDMAKVLVGSRTNFKESLPWKYGSGGGSILHRWSTVLELVVLDVVAVCQL